MLTGWRKARTGSAVVPGAGCIYRVNGVVQSIERETTVQADSRRVTCDVSQLVSTAAR